MFKLMLSTQEIPWGKALDHSQLQLREKTKLVKFKTLFKTLPSFLPSSYVFLLCGTKLKFVVSPVKQLCIYKKLLQILATAFFFVCCYCCFVVLFITDC